MCRFLLFVGRDPILIADLLTRPAHSIINQSFDSRLRIDLQRPLNGDGFGVGWYPPDTQQLRSSQSKLSQPVSPTSVVDFTADSLQSLADYAGEDHIVTTTLVGRGKTGSVELDEQDAIKLSVIETTRRRSTIEIQEAMKLANMNDGNGRTDDKMANAAETTLNLVKVYTSPDGPCVFTSILPAWNNMNLIRLSEKIYSRLVFAHVRAASAGFPVAETNCHPWSYGKFLWMHNGYIAGFQKMKRRLQMCVRDELYHYVQGNTDSEWMFALFLNNLTDPLNQEFTADQLKQALLKTISQLNEWAKELNITQWSLMNFAVSDGQTTLCTRYVNSASAEPASLFYSSGTRFEASNDKGEYKMVKADRREGVVIVTSEPLTFERTDWLPVPVNSIVVITEKLNVLVYPIEDEYCAPCRKVGTSWNPLFAKTPVSSSPPQVWG
jgi:glutamine amidotransferase